MTFIQQYGLAELSDSQGAQHDGVHGQGGLGLPGLANAQGGVALVV